MIDRKTLKSYPYFVDWLKELGRSIEDVENISRELLAVKELPPENGWRRFEPAKLIQVVVIFTDGQIASRCISPSDLTYIAPEEVERRNEEANRKSRAIYDQRIAPLMEQIDAVAMQYGFSYIAAFQYSEGGIAASYALKASTDKSLVDAQRVLDSAVVWETEEDDVLWADAEGE